VLERTQVVAAPIDRAFAFFQDPQNLGRITPLWIDFEILRVDGTPLAQGTRIEYRIRWLGVPQRWTAEIAEYDPPHRFVDIQVRGPYRSWRHEHIFEPIADGTRVHDRVQYELPFGPLGHIAHALVVRGQLERIFAYRAQAVERLLS
jgi:hypothetical protein